MQFNQWPLICLSLVTLLQLVSTASSQAPASARPDESMDLYLLIGQSNMAGRGAISDTPNSSQSILALDAEDQWVVAMDPLHFDKPEIVGVGPGLSFALEAQRLKPNGKIGLIPCAVGGSPISSWKPGGYHESTDTHPYDDAIRRARVAMKSGQLRGVLWHQGESDSKAGLAEIYEQELHGLIARLREDLESPQLPFVAGQMGQFDERPWSPAKLIVDAAHRRLPAVVPNTAFASSAGLQHGGDSLHFDAASSRELGRRYAMALQTIGADSQRAIDSEPMNFVFFLVDDLGWADLSCYGSTFHESPHIDRLSKEGMRFTFGYTACPVCSPTRASILTGRHPVRVDITDWIPGASADKNPRQRFKHIFDRDSLALEEVTIAELLQCQGYQTFFAGKWHLGGPGFWPTDQGFDVNIGGCDRGSPPGGYYAPWKNPNLVANADDEYLTERLTQESVQFLEQRDEQRPFLLYLSYYNVHTPITPYKKSAERFTEKAKQQFKDSSPPIVEHEGKTRSRQDNPPYASMIDAVDSSVGTILAKLDELDLSDNTAVIFFSDNGGLSTLSRPGPTCNLPLRAGKGWLYEGGIRVPTLMKIPGVTQPGRESSDPVVSTDFFPTMLELAQIPLREDLHADGSSLIPTLKGTADAATRELFWHYPHYHGSTWAPGAAIRSGPWKLIELYQYDEFELYHLENDPSESIDLKGSHPEIAKRLRDRLAEWQKNLNAKMPEPIAP